MKQYTSHEQILPARAMNRRTTIAHKKVKMPNLPVLAWTIPFIIVTALHLLTGIHIHMEFILSAIIISVLLFIGYKKPKLKNKNKNKWNK